MPRTKNGSAVRVDDEPFLVPLAIPYTAGPSALAAVLLISSRDPDRRWEWLMALLLAWLASGAILILASRMHRFPKVFDA